MAKKFQHEWGFMGNGMSLGTGDLVYCSLCNRWSLLGYKNGKPFKMTRSEWIQWHIDGKIDASECLSEEQIEKYKNL